MVIAVLHVDSAISNPSQSHSKEENMYTTPQDISQKHPVQANYNIISTDINRKTQSHKLKTLFLDTHRSELLSFGRVNLRFIRSDP